MYELILFNIVQNAIKFNRLEGDIVILINFKKQTTSYEKHMYLLNSSVTSHKFEKIIGNEDKQE